jgi:Kef-type K+ transport system membrane component KefB
MMARSREKERVEHGVHALAYGLFVPIFFVNIGLSVNARTMQTDSLMFTVVIILVAILGKWVGAGSGGRLGGLSLRESVQLGAGMISRGEVGLIVAGVGINEGLISSNEFSAIVAMVLVTTLVTPPMLRSLFAQKKHEAQSESPETEDTLAPANLKDEEAD